MSAHASYIKPDNVVHITLHFGHSHWALPLPSHSPPQKGSSRSPPAFARVLPLGVLLGFEVLVRIGLGFLALEIPKKATDCRSSLSHAQPLERSSINRRGHRDCCTSFASRAQRQCHVRQRTSYQNSAICSPPSIAGFALRAWCGSASSPIRT